MSKKKQDLKNTEIKKKAMLQALEGSLGIVYQACKKVGISRRTHYYWCEKDEDYLEAVNDISEIALDLSESKLLENINKGKEASIFFHLKTKGKSRGYVERTEHTGADGKDLYEKMTDEELEEKIEKLRKISD